MKDKRNLMAALTLFCVVLAPASQAHTLASEGATLLSGLSHTLLGWDHLLGLLAIGFFISRQTERSLWRLPLVLLSTMALGAGIAQAGVPLPMVEAGIATSLLVFGLLLALAARVRMLTSMVVIGLFALFHGHAHGTEIPQATSLLVYGSGFMLAAAALQGLGIALGRLCKGERAATLVRAGGIALGTTSALMWV